MSDSILIFGSTILGAAIAALFSWLLARRTSKETLARDREQRLETKLGLALQAFVKLKTVIDNQWTVHEMLEQALAHPPSADARPWQCVERTVSHRGEYLVEFTAAELALFMEAQRGEIAESMQMLARRNATVGAVLERYNECLDVLRAKMPPPQVLEGGRRTTAFTEEQYMALAPHMAILDSLIEQLVPVLREDTQLGHSIAAEFGPVLRKHFDDERFPAFVIPPPEEENLPD